VDKFLEALRPYGGTVLQTSLPYDAEQQLMQTLHGTDTTAPTWEQEAPAGAIRTPATGTQAAGT
jgi:hypothetical protein